MKRILVVIPMLCAFSLLSIMNSPAVGKPAPFQNCNRLNEDPGFCLEGWEEQNEIIEHPDGCYELHYSAWCPSTDCEGCFHAMNCDGIWIDLGGFGCERGGGGGPMLLVDGDRSRKLTKILERARAAKSVSGTEAKSSQVPRSGARSPRN